MAHIPTYVMVIFFGLVYIGIKRCFPRTVSPSRLFVFPAILVANGLHSMVGLLPDMGVLAVAFLSVAALVGVGMGWLHGQRWHIEFNADRSMVSLPGDPSLLVIILLSFVFQFALHYALAAHLPIATSALFVPGALAVWGWLAGMPLGRALNVLARRDQAGTASMQVL